MTIIILFNVVEIYFQDHSRYLGLHTDILKISPKIHKQGLLLGNDVISGSPNNSGGRKIGIPKNYFGN